MNIYFEEEQQVEREILDTMEKAAEYCLELEGVDTDRSEVSVTFVSAEEIRTLNRDFRDTDRVTDVLSFPQFEDLNDVPDFGEICLGDVVICSDRVREQAQELLLSPLASKGSKVPSEIWKNIPSDWFPLPLYCATADEF